MSNNLLNILHSDYKGVYYWIQPTLDDLPKKKYIVVYDEFIGSPNEDFIPFKWPKID